MCFNFFRKKDKQTYPQSFSQSDVQNVSQPTQQPNETAPAANFKFKLTAENQISANGHKEIVEPSLQQLQEAAEVLKLAEENFIILESSSPVNNVSFLQATGYNGSDGTVYAEAQVQTVKNGQASYHIYSQTMSLLDFIKTLLAFMGNAAPDLNTWDYVMEI